MSFLQEKAVIFFFSIFSSKKSTFLTPCRCCQMLGWLIPREASSFSLRQTCAINRWSIWKKCDQYFRNTCQNEKKSAEIYICFLYIFGKPTLTLNGAQLWNNDARQGPSTVLQLNRGGWVQTPLHAGCECVHPFIWRCSIMQDAQTEPHN